jgi:hypothetical protein
MGHGPKTITTEQNHANSFKRLPNSLSEIPVKSLVSAKKKLVLGSGL